MLSGISFDKNTSHLAKGMGIYKYSKEYEDTNEYNKMEKYIDSIGGNFS